MKQKRLDFSLVVCIWRTWLIKQECRAGLFTIENLLDCRKRALQTEWMIEWNPSENWIGFLPSHHTALYVIREKS